MPIDKYTTDGAGLPRIGKLVKGSAKKVNAPGADLDHFRFVSNRPEVHDAFYSVYPAQPREVNAYLQYPTMEENYDYWNKLYGAGSLKRKCDGTTCVLRQEADSSYSTTPIPCVCANSVPPL